MQPLAERLRPQSLDQYVGQQHLVGISAPLRKAMEQGLLPSLILWGPPGVGKTTLALLIANHMNRPIQKLNAVHSGVKEVREAIDVAERQHFFQHKQSKPILFIDEIHRFSKSQQDSLLGAVEKGTITLIGATTENPSFEVIPALLSRCQVYVLEALGEPELELLLKNALENDPTLKAAELNVQERDALFRYAGGDARKLYNILELVAGTHTPPIQVTDQLIIDTIQQNIAQYDKNGELHYDIISAFIKSIRGSDPNGALYWLARMIEGGEDLLFIARRLLVLAAEDIGLANPNALLLANSAYQAVHAIGYPEARIILSEVVVYLATSPKSNSTYLAIEAALQHVRTQGALPVPLHLRNAPTKLMKNLNYGKNYQYAHNYAGNFVSAEFLPDAIKGMVFYNPQDSAAEQTIRQRLHTWWADKYKY